MLRHEYVLGFARTLLVLSAISWLAPDVAMAAASGGKDAREPWDVEKPRGEWEDLTFETHEGTWMSVDVSPDGSTVLFDLLGDLYTVPMRGGQATRLTHGRAWDTQPRYSPDGQEILFTSDRGGTDNLWIAGASGSAPRALTKEKDKVTNCGAWSVDGETIAAKRRLTDHSSIGTTELWLVHRTGGQGIQISTKDELPEVSEPVFHPDGRFLYLSARSSRFSYNRNVHQGIYQIRRYDLQTGQMTAVTGRFGGAGNPCLSPDGRWLAYVTRDGVETGIVLHDLVSGAERMLTTGLDHDLQESFAWAGVYPAMDFTPDGQALVVYARGKLWRIDASDGEWAEIPFRAHVEQTVQKALRFEPDVVSDRFQARMLRWAQQFPQGGRIVFQALGRIYRADADGGNAQVLLRGDDDEDFEYAPRLSPDGKSLAYVTWNDESKGHVWTARAQGTGAKQITRIPGQYANPSWSPDGRQLVFLRGSGATLRGDDLAEELWHEIYVVDAKGGEPRYVVSVATRGAQARMPTPTFGPEGSRIYFLENDEKPNSNTVQYSSVRLDGTDKQIHATVKYGEEFALSPSGKWLAYKHLHDAYVAPMPLAGQKTLELGDTDGPVRVKKLSDGLADWVSWTDDETLTWVAGPSFYRQTLSNVRAALAEADADVAAKKSGGAGEDAGEDKSEDKSEDTGEDGGKESNEGSRESDSPGDGATTDGENDAPTEAVDPFAPAEVEIVLEVERHRPLGTLVLDGARVITMGGDEVIERGVIVVENERIVSVGSSGQVTIPDGAHVVDASGLTAIPGLVDAHAHMGYGGLDINPQRDWRYYANLAYGVTTTMDPSASTHLVFSQAEMVEAGAMKGPRVYSTGFILYGADLPGKAPTSSLEDARRHVRRMKKLGAFAVKSYMQPRREQRQWYIEAAREEKMLVFPEGGGNFEANMNMVLDGHTGIEHCVPVAQLYDDVVQLWSRTRVGYTPTLLVAYGGLAGEGWFYQNEAPVWQNDKLLRFTPRPGIMSRARRLPLHAYEDDWVHKKVAASAKRLAEAGVGVNMGAHGQLQGLGCHWELWSLAHGGMEPLEVLRSGTVSGAHYIGLGAHLGSLEAGKLADIVLLDRNPLEDIRNTDSVRYVVKNGELFDAASMDQLYPVEARRKPFLWQ